jgi:peroxiredoxin
MKFCFAWICILAFSAAAFAQASSKSAATFSISGKIGTLNKPTRIYLDYSFKGKFYTDSTDLVNGAFAFHGNVDGIAECRMTLARDGRGRDFEIYAKGAGDVIYFDFGGEKITIASKDSLYNASVQGSKIYAEQAAFRKETGLTPMDISRKANLQIQRLTPQQQQDTAYTNVVGAWVKQQRADRKIKLQRYAETHLNSRYSVSALREVLDIYQAPIDLISKMYHNLSATVKSSDAGVQFAQTLAGRVAAVAGNKAINFTQNNTAGKAVSLSDFKGKWVLLEFWASWCVPCRAEGPNLIKQYGLYKNNGFEILSVSADKDRDKWVKAIADDGYMWEQVSDLGGWNNAVCRLYAIRYVPANFLINPDGMIVATDLTGEKLNSKLQEIFAKK